MLDLHPLQRAQRLIEETIAGGHQQHPFAAPL
jgi:hypothetical protein